MDEPTDVGTVEFGPLSWADLGGGAPAEHVPLELAPAQLALPPAPKEQAA